MYYIGHSVHALTTLRHDQTFSDAWSVLYNADKALSMVEQLDKVLNLSVSRAVYKELHAAVKEARAAYHNDANAELGYNFSWGISSKADRFESVFCG
jgi:hypothetical protein